MSDTSSFLTRWLHPAALAATLALLFACATPSARAPAAPQSGASAPAQPNTASDPSVPAPPSIGGPGGPPTRVRLKTAYTTVNASAGPVWLAHDTGAFAEQGLDTELTFIGAGQAILGALSSQETPIVIAGANQVVEATLQGGDYVLLGASGSYLTQGIFVIPSIERPDDLRGKTVGVSNFGAISHVALKVALAHWGFEEGRDVTVIRSGGAPETIAAMQSGAIHGGSFGPPQSFRARDMGFRQLLDVATLRYEIGNSAIVSTRAYVAQHPDVVERYFKALIKGAHVFQTNKDLAVDAIASYGRVDDRAVAEETWSYHRDLTQVDMALTARAVQNLLNLVAESHPGAATAKPEQFFDTTIVDRLRASGYVDQVRRGTGS